MRCGAVRMYVRRRRRLGQQKAQPVPFVFLSFSFSFSLPSFILCSLDTHLSGPPCVCLSKKIKKNQKTFWLSLFCRSHVLIFILFVRCILLMCNWKYRQQRNKFNLYSFFFFEYIARGHGIMACNNRKLFKRTKCVFSGMFGTGSDYIPLLWIRIAECLISYSLFRCVITKLNVRHLNKQFKCYDKISTSVYFIS